MVHIQKQIQILFRSEFH